MFTLPLAKLDIVTSRPVANGIIFLDVITVDIKLVTFLFQSNITEQIIGTKTKNSDNHRYL